MFTLEVNEHPATTAQLAAALNASLAHWIARPVTTPMAQIDGDVPNLAAMRIDMSGGTIVTGQSPPDVIPATASEPGPIVKSFSLVANPLHRNEVFIKLELAASDVKFGYSRNRVGQMLAVLEDARNGTLSVQIDRQNLESAILLAIRSIAEPKGIAVQKAEISCSEVDPQTLDVEIRVTAKKLMTAVIRVRGRLHLDDQLNAGATNLQADGEGVAGALAVGMLRPQLQKLEGRKLPLSTFSLGKVRLRDVAVRAEDGLEISASFGSG